MIAESPAPAPSSARRVLAYFVRNPNAADSLEGVARWRLQQEIVQYTVEEVGRAIGWLLEQGFLERDPAQGVAQMFRLNRNKAADAERFLAGEGTAAAGARRRPAATEPFPPRTALLERSLAWVDATLLRYHRENPPAGGDLPGLTRSHASIESALQPRAIPVGVDQAAKDLATAFQASEAVEPLAILYQTLQLTRIELQTLLLCLAPEVDAKYQGVYGVMNDDLGRRTMTLGLLGAVLGNPVGTRTALARSGGLTRWRLLEHCETLPYGDEPLRLDPAVLGWLLGDEAALLADRRLAPVLRSESWRGADWIRLGSDSSLIERLSELLAAGETGPAWIALVDADSDGARAVIEAARQNAGRSIVRISVAATAAMDQMALVETAARLGRAVRVSGAIPVLDAGNLTAGGADPLLAVTPLIDALGGADGPGILIAPELQRLIAALPRTGVLLLQRDAAGDTANAGALAATAGEAGLEVSPLDVERLSAAFPLPLGAMTDAVRLATLGGATLEAPAQQSQKLAAALRRVASPELPHFARKIEPVFELSEVVLPDPCHAQLNEMVAHVRYASQVLNAWGFGAQLPYGRGVAALFCGPSGTGKTMAAQAVARALQTDAYVVDLSRVVSKYIGESEKNLDVVFGEAERAGAVLLFDEADALFGKRSDIKDAHDRYANIEVAYLLQRMEAFGGLAVLTTNLRRNLDEAFLRRLRFVVEFPKPDAKSREVIWRQCLPPDAPLSHDVDLPLLARRLELTGGSIRQITVRAAFAAVGEQSRVIAMRHVLSATRAELQKVGMHGAQRELEELEAVAPRRPPRVA